MVFQTGQLFYKCLNQFSCLTLESDINDANQIVQSYLLPLVAQTSPPIMWLIQKFSVHSKNYDCECQLNIREKITPTDDAFNLVLCQCHGIYFLSSQSSTQDKTTPNFVQLQWAEYLVRFIVNIHECTQRRLSSILYTAFTLGPENPWLIAAYAKSAKYPFASVIGQEIFQSGVIPSDTDYRIYRDFGKIPGMFPYVSQLMNMNVSCIVGFTKHGITQFVLMFVLVGVDIAYTYNGYIYHTKYDLPKYIPEGCIQRGGNL